MLAVQVNYQGVQETARHNKVAEKQNQEQLELGWSNLSEIKRHNLATEGIQSGQLAETARHNRATESLGYANLAYNYQSLSETTRHNIATEGVQWYQATTSRLAQQESARHNLESESISKDANSIARQRQITDAALGWSNVANAQRANDINAKNAETNAFKAETDRRRQEQSWTLGIWSNINDSIRTFSDYRRDSVRNVTDMFNSIVPFTGGN